MKWDLFQKAELHLSPGLTTAEIRDRLLRGELQREDLVRPAGSDTPWVKLADMPDLIRDRAIDEEPTIQVPGPGPDPVIVETAPVLLDENGDAEDRPPVGSTRPGRAVLGGVHSPLIDIGEEEDEDDPLVEDEHAAEFTLTRGGVEHVEELDLAAMVDVAFQMVLFFLVTSATVMYKTLEIPPPNSDSKNAGAQTRRTLDDLAKDYILIDIDPSGNIQVDHRPVPVDELVDRLRQAREETARSAMLLTADFTTPHRHAVQAYDAANEIGLRIAIAKPVKSAEAPAKRPPDAKGE